MADGAKRKIMSLEIVLGLYMCVCVCHDVGNNWNYSQACREPQRGPGKHYRGALIPYSVCLEIEKPKASKGRKRGERCPLTIRLGVRGAS